MTVYILFEHDSYDHYGSYDVESVHLTKEGAKAEKERLSQKYPRNIYYIDTVETKE